VGLRGSRPTQQFGELHPDSLFLPCGPIGNERQDRTLLEFAQWFILSNGGFMNIQDIFAEIDAEISKLQKVKALLSGTSTAENRKPHHPGHAKTRRTLSTEARERIAAAQRARWAKSKKAAAKAARINAGASTAKKATTAGLRARKTKKRTLSAGARAKIAAAQKARWTKVRKAAKKAASAKAANKPAPTKKAVSAKRAGASKTKVPVSSVAPATTATSAS
jgi:hypothetical protein